MRAEVIVGGKDVKRKSSSQESPLVLVVDDDDGIRMLLRETMEHYGLSVAEAGSGAEALSVFSTLKPELVILDVVMPEMDGFETCARLRRLPGGEATPVLMLTGLDDLESVDKAYEAGATDFASKPLKWLALGHRVRYMLRAKRAMDDLRTSESRLATAQRIARLGNWERDLDGGTVECSDEMYQIFGIAPQLAGTRYECFLERVHPEDRHVVVGAVEDAIRRGQPYSTDHRILMPDGTVRFVHEQAEILPDEAGRPALIVGTTQDITERKQAEEQIRFLADYDSLTHLPNRRLFKERLESVLASARRHKRLVATLFMDLDHFKRINDTLGHSAGDKLLQEVAERLRCRIRPTDAIARGDPREPDEPLARLGGDEFVLSIIDITRGEDAARVALRILEVLKDHFVLEGHEVFITASIGISVYPSDGEDVEALLKNADTAMYHAKSAGRNRYQFYDGSMNSSASHRLSMETGLRRAIERDELVLHYQPQFDVRDGSIVGAEALVRWKHPELGLVPPADFIPLAEETGLIVPIGGWVLCKAFHQSRAWHRDGFGSLRIAVNLSGHQLQPRFVRMLEELIRTAGFNPSFLELEITESVFMQRAEETIGMLNDLKSMGLRISIDDFGTGYSSLSYLKRFPVDTLKIDRSFVRDVATHPDDAAITVAIIAMARSLELETIAEGVETREQLVFLQQQGCSLMQGFLLGRPVPAEEFTRALRKNAAEMSPGVPM